ncbi:MAG: ammonium transporter [Gammaproteobacteria bacterium]|nr:ammonium transporter [Gammaproteobacteria bacterium]
MRSIVLNKFWGLLTAMLIALSPLLVSADEAKPAEVTPAAAPAPMAAMTTPAAAPTPTVNKADTTWMLISTALVILMTIPGLALFYGGLVRSKNMLSVLTQVFVIFCVIAVLWAIYGYSYAFTEGGRFIGGTDRLFLKGLFTVSVEKGVEFANGATFSKGVAIPEIIFMAFQLTFAAITTALVVGGFAERVKFSSLLVFSVLWFTFSYLPMAHMVWFWMGPDGYTSAAAGDAMNLKAGFLFQKGALDFAGGTVVHINAGMAALMGSIVIGKRIGFPKTAMPPHSLTMTMIGACLLWVGWFGFNAGSNLEATGMAALAMVNTILATAGAALSWLFVEWMIKGKPSLLGGVSGAVAGLVAVTPAAGFSGPMGAIVLGAVAGVGCLWAVTSLKKMLGYDDTLDVFGVHAIGGIIGALGTGIVVNPALGGSGVPDFVSGTVATYSFHDQMISQLWGVCTVIVLSGVVSFVLFTVIKMVMGLRVSEEAEREGLDVAEHGEKAYNM